MNIEKKIKGFKYKNINDFLQDLRKVWSYYFEKYPNIYHKTVKISEYTEKIFKDLEMMNDNIKTFTDFVPLNESEMEATAKAREIIRQVRQIPCTNCRYCTEVCPKEIPIPEIFTQYNSFLAAKTSKNEAKSNLPTDKPQAGDCIVCGACEKICPQMIPIRKHLETVSKW